jgi:hypothetical protein
VLHLDPMLQLTMLAVVLVEQVEVTLLPELAKLKQLLHLQARPMLQPHFAMPQLALLH